jgi:hypothetical protein
MWGRIDLRRVAKEQRRLLCYILAVLATQIAGALLPFPVPPAVLVLVLLLSAGTLILVITGVVRLQRAMGNALIWQILAALFMLITCVNIVVLLMINRRATNILKRAGLKVGLMGVSDAEVERVLARHICKGCGYNLMGNVSGVCPECGKAVPGGDAAGRV